MKFLWCLIRGHRPIPVEILDVWLVHGYGIQTLYAPDPAGDAIACERCGHLLVPTEKKE